jgi:hypothetical protein
VSIEFTPREVTELAGTPQWAVEKAIEQNVLALGHGPRGRRKRSRLLPLYAVAYVKVVDSVELRMDLKMKRRLAAMLAKLEGGQFASARLELAPAVEVDVGRLVGDAVRRAETYGAVRDATIVEDEGEPRRDPFIRDSEVSVYDLAERLDGGESIDQIRAEYPSLSQTQIETAAIYVRAHPPVGAPPRLGRRPGRPRPAGRWAGAGDASRAR